jgi:hypothetical protein
MSELTALFTAKTNDEIYHYEVTESSVKALREHNFSVDYDNEGGGDVTIKWDKRKVVIPAYIFLAMPEIVAMMHMMDGNLISPVEISRARSVCSLFTDIKKEEK